MPSMEKGDIDSGMVFSVRAIQFQVDALMGRYNLMLACSRLKLYYFFSDMSMNLDCLRAQNVICPELHWIAGRPAQCRRKGDQT